MQKKLVVVQVAEEIRKATVALKRRMEEVAIVVVKVSDEMPVQENYFLYIVVLVVLGSPETFYIRWIYTV